MIRHLHQAQVQRDDGRWRPIAGADINRFEPADFRGKQVIRGQCLRVAPHLGDAPVVLECFDQQRLHQQGNAIGASALRLGWSQPDRALAAEGMVAAG